MSRTSNSIRNITYAILGQGMTFLFSFFVRAIFIRTLGSEYLGLNGLFSNILSVLSMAELGVGSAIIYSMYKPLASKDEMKLIALMNFYKKIYVSIGLFILTFGLMLTPFLSVFVKEMPNIPFIKTIYVLYVIESASTYFFSYKRSFLIADQKKYIDSFYQYSFYLIRTVLQIFILLVTKNFLLYLIIQIIFTVIHNTTISVKTDRLYPFLKEKNAVKMEKDDIALIVKNTKALIMHKIGSVLVLGTDNLIISKFIGIVEVGLYSNYMLIIVALSQTIGMIFQSVTSSIGNLGVTEEVNKNIFVFKVIDLIGYWIVSFTAISLVVLLNPLINLWLGTQYMFPNSVVLLIVMSFYFTVRRKSILTFKDAFGLFWYDRYKPLLESGINLTVSLVLVQFMGIEGVIIGTIFSTLTTCVTVEPYVLYKYGFKISSKGYYLKYAMHTGITVVVGFVTWTACSVFSSVTLGSFIGKLIIAAIIPNMIFLAIFWKSQEFQYLLRILKNIINKKLRVTVK